MAKNKKLLINRKIFDRVRKMDHGQMTLWVESVYQRGFDAGKASVKELSSDEVKATILEIKGVGEKKACDIVIALEKAKEEK